MIFKQPNKTVVFDCDDVLANLRDPLQDIVSEHLGKKVFWKDWDQYEIGKIYNFNFTPICELLVSRKILESLIPDEGAVELVHKVKQMGYRTLVLTARGYHPHGKEITQEWFVGNNIPIDEVICANIHEKKRDYLKNLGPIHAYFEDNHDHAEQACGLENVHQVFLLDRPWNKHESKGIRIHNLKHMSNIVTGQFNLH